MQEPVKKHFASHPELIPLLKQNSHWFKLLNRNPDNLKVFLNAMKEKYKTGTLDKFNSLIDNIDLITHIIESLN